ncbi:hypothetical protein SAVIM338S_03296 [Streptomyces avidinii]
MRTKLAGIVGIIALGLTVVLGVSGELESNSVDRHSVEADSVGPGSPKPQPSPGL